MKQAVERILQGKFDYEKGALDFSVPRIELSLNPGEIYTGSFGVFASNERLSEGNVYSDDLRMTLITDSFSGASQEIAYTFSAVGLEEGDVVSHEFHIISNQGEYYIPYVVTIQHRSIESSLGSIKNLFHFTNLAKSNWDEAVRLFYSDDFINIFNGNDRQFKTAYLGLSRFYGNEQNVEEFLLVVNKKHKIEYILERDTVNISDPSGIAAEFVQITRNGWGYTHLLATTDSEFVILPKTIVSDNDFLGNYLNFEIEIDASKLHDGTNYASVIFANAFTEFKVKVVATKNMPSKAEFSKALEKQHAYHDLMTYYTAFRTHKISFDTWLAESNRIVDHMQLIDEKTISGRLFKAQLLIAEERYNEAKWLLDQCENEFADRQDYYSAGWAYYLYLTTLYNREESYVNDITREVENLYQRDPSEWRIAWMLLYLSEEYAVSPSRKWLFLERLIEMQCSSPVIYVEAVNMIVANPAMVTRLEKFELRILRYTAANNLLTVDLANQFVYLASRETTYSDVVFYILKECYKLSPTPDVVTAICELLIKGDKKGTDYLYWYTEAIKAELRITRLYEYYMQSLDINKHSEIPKMVYLYFSYETNLDYKTAAYLYANVIMARDEMPEVFETYRERIERFALDEILAGHIDKNLAVIFKFALSDVVLDNTISVNLSKLIFMHKISISNSIITKVIVYQDHEKVEQSFPVENGEAFVPIYNKDFTILFEDALSNRYMASVEYDLEKLMIPGKTATMLIPFVHDNLEFDIYSCECSSKMVEINDENRDRFKSILTSPDVEDSYKYEIRNKLMQYYQEHDAIRELDELLDSILPADLNRHERGIVIRFMVSRGMYDKALAWVYEYGLECCELKDIVTLCDKLIVRNDYVPDEKITRAAAYVFFKGKYDETILEYLVKNYTGMTKDMRRVFKAAENFNIDVYPLCENMIIQMLYTGYFVAERMSIYKRYIQGGANSDIQMAFLSQCAFEFFVKEQIMESFVFEEITKAFLRGDNLQTVCKLAYLKFYSENKSETDSTILDAIRVFLDSVLSEGIYMSFFKEFLENSVSGVNRFSDKTIIEYKTDPGTRVWIHYIIEDDEESHGEYVTEEMPDMYGGVHAKAFILFFGENLLYYITEERGGEELLTESASISKSDISHVISDSRFNEINDIVIAKTLKDYDTVDSLVYDYYKQEYVVKKMFTLQ